MLNKISDSDSFSDSDSYNCYAIKQNKVELIDTQGKINQ